MFDSEFESALSLADDVISEQFSNVLVFKQESAEGIPGIFDNPEMLSQFANGGQLKAGELELSMRDIHASGIKDKSTVQLQFKSGKTEKFTVVKALNDGSGWVKITLSSYQERKPIDIRY